MKDHESSAKEFRRMMHAERAKKDSANAADSVERGNPKVRTGVSDKHAAGTHGHHQSSTQARPGHHGHHPTGSTMSVPQEEEHPVPQEEGEEFYSDEGAAEGTAELPKESSPQHVELLSTLSSQVGRLCTKCSAVCQILILFIWVNHDSGEFLEESSLSERKNVFWLGLLNRKSGQLMSFL